MSVGGAGDTRPCVSDRPSLGVSFSKIAALFPLPSFQPTVTNNTPRCAAAWGVYTGGGVPLQLPSADADTNMTPSLTCETPPSHPPRSLILSHTFECHIQ